MSPKKGSSNSTRKEKISHETTIELKQIIAKLENGVLEMEVRLFVEKHHPNARGSHRCF